MLSDPILQDKKLRQCCEFQVPLQVRITKGPLLFAQGNLEVVSHMNTEKRMPGVQIVQNLKLFQKFSAQGSLLTT
jgi:hypothetical protein